MSTAQLSSLELGSQWIHKPAIRKETLLFEVWERGSDNPCHSCMWVMVKPSVAEISKSELNAFL